jgi:predicted metal-dependent hydrolase
MNAVLDIGGIAVDVIFKDIKNVHLSVYPPTGRVRISAPQRMSIENIRLFAITKIGWIKKHQRQIRRQPRETPREYVERESHYVWGRRYLLTIAEGASKPSVAIGHRTLELRVPRGASRELRQETLAKWLRAELRKQAAPLLTKWAKRLNVDLRHFHIQQMKTKWGSSSPSRKAVRLNLELVKLPLECLDYVALHELAHFVVPNHREQFRTLLDENLPGWRHVRDRLNEGPLFSI